MGKLLKWIGAIIGALVLLVVLAIVLLVTFVNPNRLKPILTNEVMKFTGRELTIDGDLSWSFFPYLGVKVGHTTLGNPAQFKQKTFAEISSVTVGVKLLPLMYGRIESSGIVLDGMKLNLIKNTVGEVNWDFQVPAAKAASQTTTAEKTVNGAGAAIGLAVSALDVSNANVNYTDEQQKQVYDVTHFDLHAKDINLTNSFPVNTVFDFSAKNPAASGHITLSGDTSLDLAKQVYAFRNAEFTAKIQQAGKNIDIKLMGNLLADLKQQTVEWSDLKGKVENISLSGKMDVVHVLTNPVARGQVDVQPFDLKETLTAIGQPAANLQAAKDVSGHVNFTAGAKNVNVQSSLKIETLQAAKLTMKNIAVKAQLQNGVLNVAPISANLYQGTLDGQAKVNLNSPSMPVSVQAKLSNVQAEPLLQDLGGSDQKLKISGVGNFAANVTTALANPDAVTRNLNGTSSFSFNNGSIIGIDLGYLVDTAYAVATQKTSSAENKGQTNFGNLTGTAVITNGVVSNKDLNSDSPRFATKGQGTIDLVKQQINYELQTSVKQRSSGDNLQNLYGIAIPVLITGSLANPSIRLDSAAIMHAVAQQQIQNVTNKAKEKIKEKLQDQLKGQLNDQAGALLNNLLK